MPYPRSIHNDDPTQFERFEYTGWQSMSNTYDHCWGHVTGAFVPPLIDALGELATRRLLDVATGPGYAASLARSRGADATGIDFSPGMIEVARASHPGITFQVADVHALPFADKQFDVVTSNFGAQHFSDLLLAFREIARVMKPAGRCALTVWADSDLNSASDILDAAVDQHADRPSPVPPGPDYHQLVDEAARHALLGDAGFDVRSLRSRLVTIPWRLHTIDELFHAELRGSVRSGARLRNQSVAAQARIRTAMAERIEARYRDDRGYVLPMAAYLITGSRR